VQVFTSIVCSVCWLCLNASCIALLVSEHHPDTQVGLQGWLNVLQVWIIVSIVCSVRWLCSIASGMRSPSFMRYSVLWQMQQRVLLSLHHCLSSCFTV
jgi:hypothetical protein